MNVFVTSANGFIGRTLCSRLVSDNKVVGVDITSPADGALNIVWERADLTDRDLAAAICDKHSPDVVIHCAGIAHQKIDPQITQNRKYASRNGAKKIRRLEE